MENYVKKSRTTRIEFYDKSLHSEIEQYQLSDEQLTFTAHPQKALVACENDASRFPLVILSGHEIAGFFVLHGWEGVKVYYENQHALLLRAYSINHSSQGKGIAKQSLKLLPEFVKDHFPDINEIILAVNRKNTKAQYVYKTAGFIDKGIRAMGRSGELLILHLKLKKQLDIPLLNNY